ncbi:hypothetical protein DXG01_017111, partial [Tephrocybe rancida]
MQSRWWSYHCRELHRTVYLSVYIPDHLLQRHINTLQQQENGWHADTDDFAVFAATMNCPPDPATNPLVVNASTFSTLVQYRIVDTALFRDKALPTRKAVIRPELKDRKLPSLGTKLPERLFTAICRRQTNKRATNIIVNLESAAFHLRYLLEGHPDLPSSKDELLAYFAQR